MKGLQFKLAIATLTFLAGLGFVAAAFLLQIDSATSRALPTAVTTVLETDFVLNPCDFEPDGFGLINAEQAIHIAECFVIENGYTDLPPSSDPSRIVPENVYPLTDEFGMSLRKNSLKREAHSISRDVDAWGGSWIVMFRLKGAHDRAARPDEWGGMVTMDFFGENVRIRHSAGPLHFPGSRSVESVKRSF